MKNARIVCFAGLVAMSLIGTVRADETTEQKVAELRKAIPTGILIVEAKWGRGNEWKDVTDICQNAVAGDSVTVPVSGDAFLQGDGRGKMLRVTFNDGKRTYTREVDDGGTFQVGDAVTSFVRFNRGLRPLAAEVATLRKKFPTGLLVLDARYGMRNQFKDIRDLCQDMVAGDSLTVTNIAESFQDGWSGGKEVHITYYDGEGVKTAMQGEGGVIQIGSKVTSFVRMNAGLQNLEKTVASLRTKYPKEVLVLDAHWDEHGSNLRDLTDECQTMASGDSLTITNSAEAFLEGWTHKDLLVTYFDKGVMKKTRVGDGGVVQVGPTVTSFVRMGKGMQNVNSTVAQLRAKYPGKMPVLDARFGKDNYWTDVTEACQREATSDGLGLQVSAMGFGQGQVAGGELRVTYVLDNGVETTRAGDGSILKIGGGVAAPKESVQGSNAEPQKSSTPAAATVVDAAAEDGKHMYVSNADMSDSIFLEHRQLRVLGADGTTPVRTLNLEHDYVKIAERAGYFVAIRLEPMAMDLLDKVTGKVKKTIKLDYRKFRDMVLAPGKAISYVAVEYTTSVPSDRIVVVNEESGDVREPKNIAGTFLQIDRSGKHLWAGLKDYYQEGSGYHINPDWSIIEVPEYGNIDMLLSYDIIGDGLVMKEHLGEVGGNGTGIRLSPDGKRVSYLSFTGFPVYSKNLAAWAGSDFDKKPVVYNIKGRAETKAMAFHPVLPLVAIGKTDGVLIFNRETGDEELDRVEQPKDFGMLTVVKDVNYSANGANVILVYAKGDKWSLRSLPLSLSATEKETIKAGLKEKPAAEEPVRVGDKANQL